MKKIKWNKHQEMLTKIINKPYHVHDYDKGVTIRATEVALYQNNIKIAEPDIVIIDNHKLIHIAEYKCSRKGLRRGHEQVATARAFMLKHYHLDCVTDVLYGAL